MNKVIETLSCITDNNTIKIINNLNGVIDFNETYNNNLKETNNNHTISIASTIVSKIINSAITNIELMTTIHTTVKVGEVVTTLTGNPIAGALSGAFIGTSILTLSNIDNITEEIKTTTTRGIKYLQLQKNKLPAYMQTLISNYIKKPVEMILKNVHNDINIVINTITKIITDNYKSILKDNDIFFFCNDKNNNQLKITIPKATVNNILVICDKSDFFNSFDNLFNYENYKYCKHAQQNNCFNMEQMSYYYLDDNKMITSKIPKKINTKFLNETQFNVIPKSPTISGGSTQSGMFFVIFIPLITFIF